MEAFISEGFLEGLSTRDLPRITEKHLGTRDDSKQVSRIVERASMELDAWQNRPLAGNAYQLLFVDGTHVRIRIKQWVEPLAFCVVLAISAQAHVIDVLGVMMGDREQLELWAQLFHDLARRGLDMNAVELRVMDGLPGLETCFTQHFSRAQPQRCQKHASANPVRRVQKADRESFSQALNKVFYDTTEAKGVPHAQSPVGAHLPRCCGGD